MRKVPKEAIQKRVDEALDLVELPHRKYGRRKITQLSGGERQRVALARALVTEPRVLLLDEPFGALDLKLRKQMQVETKKLQARLGITFIFVTHDQEEALTMSNVIGVINKGRVEQMGNSKEIYERPATRFVAGFIGAAKILKGTIDRGGDERRSSCRCARRRAGAGPTRGHARTCSREPSSTRSTSASRAASRSSSTWARSSSRTCGSPTSGTPCPSARGSRSDGTARTRS